MTHEQGPPPEMLEELDRLRQRVAELEQVEAERGQVESALRQRHRELALLHRASQTFTSSLDLEQVLEMVLEEVRHLLDVIACSVWLIDQETGELVCRQAAGPSQEIVRGWRLPVGQGLAGWVAGTGESLNVPDTRLDERHYKGVDLRSHFELRSILSIPLRIKEGVIGVIQVSDTAVDRFGVSDLALLEPLAAAAAIAIENARLYQEADRLRAFNQDIVLGLNEGLLLHDPDGYITFVNPRLEEMLGCGWRELVGLHWRDIMPQEHIPLVEAESFKRAQGVSSRYESALLTRDGREVPVIVSARPLFEDGVLTSVLGIFTDITQRLEAEQALIESEQQIRTTLDSLGDATHVIGSDLRIVLFNAAFRRWNQELGLETDVIGCTPFEVFPFLSPQIGQEYQQVFEAGKTLVSEDTFRVGDHHYITETRKIPVLEKGRVVRVVTVVRDITERRQAEDALARRAREMAALYETSLEINAQLDLDTLLPAIVRRAADLLDARMGGLYLTRPGGGSLELVVGHNLPGEIIGTVLEVGQGVSGRVLQTGQPLMVSDYLNWEGQASVYQGKSFRRVVGVPLKRGERVIGVINITDDLKTGTFTEDQLRLLSLFADQAAIAIEKARLYQEIQQELSERARAEAAMRRAYMVVENSPAVFFRWSVQDTGLVIDYVSGNVTQFGYSTEQFLSGELTFSEIIHPEDRDQTPDQIKKSATKKADWLQQEYRLVAQDGSVRWVDARTWPEIGPDGRVTHVQVVVTDITQHRDLSQQLEQQERLAAVGQLAAGIAHDFNNILASIILSAQLALQDPRLPQRSQERLETIHQQGRRAADLIQQILDYSRRAILEKRTLDMVSFLRRMERLLRRILPENIRIRVTHGAREYLVSADATRIQQVVMNLAVNSRDAMPDGGELHFDLSLFHLRPGDTPPFHDMEPGRWVCLAVHDTGHGIPPEVLPHIYEPFFTTKDVGEGTGLGLSQVFGIVKQHDGHISVDSQPGFGATFIIYLPALLISEDLIVEDPLASAPVGHGERILLVEDDPITQKALSDALEVLGYQVLGALNGRQALASFRQHRESIDLVLSDLVMPELGGLDLLQALKADDPGVRVVVISGYPLEGDSEDLKSAGVLGWLQKPVSLEKLAQTVAEVLRKGRAVS